MCIATSWNRKWQSLPVFLPGKSHGQHSLMGHSPYSPWGYKDLDRTDWAHYNCPAYWPKAVSWSNTKNRIIESGYWTKRAFCIWRQEPLLEYVGWAIRKLLKEQPVNRSLNKLWVGTSRAKLYNNILSSTLPKSLDISLLLLSRFSRVRLCATP